jgi:hypothetical protein
MKENGVKVIKVEELVAVAVAAAEVVAVMVVAVVEAVVAVVVAVAPSFLRILALIYFILFGC